jgi:hypothetical protein
MKKFCIVLIAVFTLGFVYACEAKTEKKADATPAKQEEAKKEAQTIKVDPQIQYVVTKSDNGGWVVQVMLGGQRLYTYVYDNKGFEDYWKKQTTPPVKEEVKKKPVAKKTVKKATTRKTK